MKAVKMWNTRFCWTRLLAVLTVGTAYAELSRVLVTYDWNTEGHGVEGYRGDDHDDEHNPDSLQLAMTALRCGR